MKYLLIATVFILLIAKFSDAQKTLLDVQIKGSGNASPQGERLFLRLYDNGNYEFEEDVIDEKGLYFLVRNGSISLEKVKSFQDFINNNKFQIPENVDTSKNSIDYIIEFKIAIRIGDSFQRTKIVNLSLPKLSKEKKYAPLIDLLCRIEKIRNNTSFLIDPELKNYCSK
jgi:hypothetical protein